MTFSQISSIISCKLGMIMKHLVYFLLVISLAASCQHSVPKVQEQHETPLVIQERELNPHGSLFYAERMEDTYVENVGLVATYRFIARRFPRDASYLLASQNLGRPLTPVAWYKVDDEGMLGRQIDAGTLMLDNEMILMFDYCRGESVEYWLCSQDSKARLGCTFVPYPIEAEAHDGARISLRRLTQNATLVLLEGYDFNPDEELYITSQSGPLKTENVPIECKNGRFSMIFEPAVPGKSGGVAYVDVQRKNGRLTLEYDWGSEAVNSKKRLANTTKIKQDALLKIPVN